ncbi:MAG: putative amidohydrolase YtcJ [Halioglobus sp.]
MYVNPEVSMKYSKAVSLLCCLIVALLAGCAAQGPDNRSNEGVVIADQIFTGGSIVTLDTEQPSADAVAVKTGKIIAVGSAAELGKYIGQETQTIDFTGQTLLPGFIDGHSHFSHAAGAASWANVSGAPVGAMASIADIVAEMQALKERNRVQAGEWLIGYGYDADTLTDGRHITRDDLDVAFPNNPVLLIHVSFHGGVLNSRAFAEISYDENTPTPAGGIIVRRDDSDEPLGLLMETAWFPAIAILPRPSGEGLVANIIKTQQHYAANGVTTAQDGIVSMAEFSVLKDTAARGELFIDLVALGSYAEVPQFVAEHQTYAHYNQRLKLGGIKLITDGSPQGKTAFFSDPYLTGGPGGEQNWSGEPMLPAEQFSPVLAAVYAAGMQAYVHANADAAVDMLLEAHKTHMGQAGEDSRTVIIHSQFIRPDQLESYVGFGMVPAFFSNHAYFWGDVHVENIGERRAHYLSPMNSAGKLGIHFTNHSDYMVTPLSPLFTVWSAVNRVSRSGEVIGAGERITPLQALKAITLDAAWQYREEESKGSVSVGKKADFVVLDANPLTVDPMKIKDIAVVATYKEGREIFSK